jgi:ribosomal protein S21
MAVNVEILLDDFSDIDHALRQLKKRTQAAGLWQDMKRHEEYLPPSVRRRNKSAKARAKVRKNLKRREATEARFEDVKFTRRAQGPLDSTPKGTL